MVFTGREKKGNAEIVVVMVEEEEGDMNDRGACDGREEGTEMQRW